MLSLDSTTVVVLAAGKGTRMNIDFPKVLAELQGKPLVHYVLEQVAKAGINDIVVVVGYQGERVKAALKNEPMTIRFAEQTEQLGTGHAVASGLTEVPDTAETVLATYGDMPFISAATFTALVKQQQDHAAAAVITTVMFDEPMAPAFGRVIRDDQGRITKIVEQKVCTPLQLKIKECNAGAVAYDAKWLKENIKMLQKSAVGEYYLTDLVELAAEQGQRVESITVNDPREMHGINTPEHLKAAEELVGNGAS